MEYKESEIVELKRELDDDMKSEIWNHSLLK